MPNTYTTAENGTHILDRSGKKYRCNVAHPLPLPEGISANEWAENAACGAEQEILFGGPEQGWGEKASTDTHWLARTPLPEVPRQKTQAERDADACNESRKAWTAKICPDIAPKTTAQSGFDDGFYSALAYLRGQQP